jgi:membrane-associated phospholipid phosphatase
VSDVQRPNLCPRLLGVWFIVFSVMALLAALALDRTVAQFLHDSNLAAGLKNSITATIIKAGGHFGFTLVIVAILGFAHPLRWQAGGMALLAALFSGANYVVKWCIGRSRPFKVPAHPGELLPFRLRPFTMADNLCFPSGHATLAFAAAASLAILLPRWRWFFYVGATVVALERVAENAHYVSDVVGAAILGIISARLARWTFACFLPAPDRCPDDATQGLHFQSQI